MSDSVFTKKMGLRTFLGAATAGADVALSGSLPSLRRVAEKSVKESLTAGLMAGLRRRES